MTKQIISQFIHVSTVQPKKKPSNYFSKKKKKTHTHTQSSTSLLLSSAGELVS